LTLTFAALADPTRRAILAQLAEGEASVTELARPFDMSLPAVSKHLKVLEKAGLITRGRDAQWRPCRIEPAALQDVDAWLDRYRRFWAGSLDRLGLYLEAVQAKDAVAATTGREKAARQRSTGTRRIGRQARQKN